MKKLLILTLGLFMIQYSYGQWAEQNTGTSQNLNDIFFLDEQSGYCVGDSGVILKTDNGGDSWIELQSPVSTNNQQVYFANTSEGWVNTGNKVLKTNDGGQTFIDITNDLFTSGQEEPNEPDFVYFNFKTPYGLVVGSFSEGNSTTVKIRKTIDNGNNWSDITTPDNINNYRIMNDNVIYAVGNLLYKSSDGGASWDTTNIMFSFPPMNDHTFRINEDGKGMAGLGYEGEFVNFQNNTATLNPHISSVVSMSFINDNTGYLNAGNYLFKTTDGGVSFSTLNDLPQEINPSIVSPTLFFVTDNIGYVCGSNGKIYKTTSGGENSNGIKENGDIKKKLSVFPNPAENNIELKYAGLQVKSLQLIDLSGRIVKTFYPESKKLNISEIMDGIYLLNVKTESGEITEKVVIK